jgi:hypothetical protein
LGESGLIGPNNSGQAPPDTLLQATNVSFVDGAIRKEGGATKYNNNVLSVPFVEAGFDWWPTPTMQRTVIVVSDGANAELQMDDNNGAFFVASGVAFIGQILPPMFVEGGAEIAGNSKKLFVFAQNTIAGVVRGTETILNVLGGTPLAAPPACAALDTGLVGAGNVDQGFYHYVITFLTAEGETTASPPSGPVYQPQAGGGVIKVVGIAIGGPTTTGRRLFRYKSGASSYKLVATINNNSDTEFYDVTAQGSLPDEDPPTVNTTNGRPSDWSGTNWPHCASLHANRLWAAGNANSPHRVYYSTPTDHENFMSVNAGAGSLEVFPGEGQYISGMLSFSGILIVWKYPKGIYTIHTRGIGTEAWHVERLTTAYGGLNGVTQVQIENDVVFLDPSGDVQLLSAVQEFTNLGSQSLSRATQIDQLVRAYADTHALRWARMIYYPYRREVHIALRVKGESVNTQRLVLDLNRSDRPRFRVSNRDICQSLWIRRGTIFSASGKDHELMAGDNAGQIWHLDQPGNEKNGVGYDSRFQTMWTDLSFADPSLAVRDKNAAFLELAFNPTGRWPVNLTVWWDARVATQGSFIPADPVGYYLGTWQLGAGVLADGSAVLIRRFRLTGGGRRMSLEVSNDQPGQDFSIAKAFLSFTAGSERTR